MQEARASKDSCTAKKIWLSHPLENFGGHVTVRPSAPQGKQCEISHFLASVGACTLIYDITYPCCDQLTAVKTEYQLTSIT